MHHVFASLQSNKRRCRKSEKTRLGINYSINQSMVVWLLNRTEMFNSFECINSLCKIFLLQEHDCFVYLQIIRQLNITTRMTTFIKSKFNKSDDQTNIDNYYRISYHIKINLPKFMKKRQLFHVKNQQV